MGFNNYTTKNSGTNKGDIQFKSGLRLSEKRNAMKHFFFYIVNYMIFRFLVE